MKLKLIHLAILVFALLQQKLIVGQIVVNAVVPTNYLSALPPTRGFGLGNFTAPPLSAFHINTNLFPVGYRTAEVFRTDAPLGATHWRMELGGIQRFRITANGNNVQTGATGNGFYNVFTNSTDRFQLENGNGANTGRATLSDAVPAGFNARHRLHLYQTAASNVFTRFGHLVTGSGLGDGAAVGIDAAICLI